MVSVPMSNTPQELLQPLDQTSPTSAARNAQRSFSWTHEGPLPLPPSENNYTRRYSSIATTSTPKPVESSFWKSNGKVPGSIKAIKTTTPPRHPSQPNITPYIPPTPPTPTAAPTPSLTTSSSSSQLASSASSSNSNSASTTPTNSRPSSPSKPKSQPPSERNSPDNSPTAPRASTGAVRSKSSSFIAIETPLHVSNGYGEFEHHCMEWKSCGRVGDSTKRDRFNKILSDPVVDMENLKKNCWKGCPGEMRAQCWKLLLGYLPANSDRRESTLTRKRQEYHENVNQYYRASKTDNESAILKQIQIDLPRTNPKMPLFRQTVIQDILERILYVWAIRHPASDYVQGINDISTPFLVVFLSEFVDNVENIDASKVSANILSNVEADTYWCLSKFLDGIQDYYTFAQPGIQRMTFKLTELVTRVDQPLTRHLAANDMNFIDFSFRWMNCVLVRELPLPLVARMWDTYLAEGESFSVFHLYVCAAFLHRWSAELRLLDFQELFNFLQRPPTNDWTCKDIELMLSEAYLWMETFQNAPAHLKSSVA